MESVISMVFAVESEAYQALNDLRRSPVTDKYVVSQASVVKSVGGKVVAQEGFDTGMETRDDTAMGGLIGALVGIVGGPIGMLLTGSMGMLAGSIADAGDIKRNLSLMEKVTEQLVNGETAIIALAQEKEPGALDEKLSKYQVSITREDAAEVAVAVKRAQEVQKQLEQDARKQLREDKKEDRQKKIEERREKIKGDFENLKKKFSKDKE